MLGIIWGSWIRDIKKTNKQTNRSHPISNIRLFFFKEWNRGLPRCTKPVKLFVCSTPFVFLGSIVSTPLFPLFYVTREVYRLLHRGRASRNRFQAQKWEKQKELANATMKWKGKGGFLTTIQIVLPAPSLPLRALPIYCHPSSWVANHTPRW